MQSMYFFFKILFTSFLLSEMLHKKKCFHIFNIAMNNGINLFQKNFKISNIFECAFIC